MLVVAFLVGESGGDPAAAPTTTAPPGPLSSTVPDLDQATAAICDPVMAAMPVTLDPGDGSPALAPRVVTPGGPSLLAWGPDPAVTLQCGVARPERLRDDVDYGPQVIKGPDGFGVTWIAEPGTDTVTWSVIDRSVYFRAVVPTGEPGYLVDFSSIIGKALPAVCTVPTPGDPPTAKYCGSRR